MKWSNDRTLLFKRNAGWKHLNQAKVNSLTYSSNKIWNKNIWIFSLELVIHKSYFRRKHGLQNLHINTNTRNWTKLKISFNLLALLVVTDICMSLTMSKSHRFPFIRHFGFLNVLTGKTERCFPWISKFLLRAHSQNFPATWKYGTERSSGIARFSFHPSDILGQIWHKQTEDKPGVDCIFFSESCCYFHHLELTGA